MAFWISLVFRGARVGGLRESHSVAEDAGQLSFPKDYPDTKSGYHYAINESGPKIDKYLRIPPAKRINYKKLGVPAPFFSPWKIVISDWQRSMSSELGTVFDEKSVHCINDFYVLRDRAKLQCLSNILTQKLDIQSFMDLFREFSFALIPICVKMNARGVPDNLSMICIPKLKDVEEFSSSSNFAGPCEEIHSDAKKLSQVKKSDFTKIETCVQVSSRNIIGFVSAGRFMFSKGKGSGLGFVSALGLLKLLMEYSSPGRQLVLVRTTSSSQYRFATLDILM